MKIYRVVVLSESTDRIGVKLLRATHPDAIAWPIDNRRFKVTIRREFLHDLELTPKQIAKMLPAWAKACMRKPKSIGDQVTAFYARNDKVKIQPHQCGDAIGSDAYYKWLETQPDPFRASRLYREQLGELHISVGEMLPA